MKKVFLLLCFFSFANVKLFAQIQFTNPDFEDTPHSDTPPIYWDSCAGSPDCASNILWYLAAYQGETYLGIQSELHTPPPNYESAGQKLNCNFLPDKIHQFTLYAYTVAGNNANQLFNTFGGRLQFWAGFGKCDLDTLLWQSPQLDTVWRQYTVEFTPNKPYNYVTFVASSIDSTHSYLGVDDLSEVTIDGYNLLSVPFSDTTINKESCVILIANSDDTTGHFVWSSIPSGLNANGGQVSVCPTQNTQYVCTITSGCGMQKSDTVSVEVTPNGVRNIQGGEYLSIYPNPAQNELTIALSNNITPQQITVTDALGRVVLSVTPHKPKTELNIYTLAAGIYFIKTQLSNGTVQVNKFVKQ